MKDFRTDTEVLLAHVIAHSGLADAAPLPGHWSFVDNIDNVYAQSPDGSVSCISMQEIKTILQTQQYVAIAVGRCDSTVLWAYMTRRYSMTCEDEIHHSCASQYCLTIEAFLPAVLIAAQVHYVDTALNLRINADDYMNYDARNYLVRMIMCEFSLRLSTCSVQPASILSTNFYSVQHAYISQHDLPPLPLRYVPGVQLIEALTPFKLEEPVLHCDEQYSGFDMDLPSPVLDMENLLDSITGYPVVADVMPMSPGAQVSHDAGSDDAAAALLPAFFPSFLEPVTMPVKKYLPCSLKSVVARRTDLGRPVFWW